MAKVGLHVTTQEELIGYEIAVGNHKSHIRYVRAFTRKSLRLWKFVPNIYRAFAKKMERTLRALDFLNTIEF